MTVSPRRTLLLSVVIFAVTIGAYAQVVRHPFVNFDDNLYVYDNPVVKGGLTVDGVRWAFAKAHASNWHPVTWLSHMLDVSLFGVVPGPHHAVNAVLHATNAALLFFILVTATKAPWRSLLAAAFFALHPLRVESVAWISERKDVLSGLFLLLTLAAYGRYSKRPGGGRYVVVVVAFVAGLMAKPMLVTVPILLLLVDVWPLDRRDHALRRVTEKLPLVVLAAGSCVATYLAQVPAEFSSIEALPLTARAANAAVSVVDYIVKTLWPVDLSVFYPHPFNFGAGIPLWRVASSILFLFAVSVAVVRWGRGRLWLPVGWFWFLVGLLPVLGFVQVGFQGMADRYTYLPSIGLCVVVAWGIPAPSSGERGRLRLAISVAAGAMLAVLFAVTWRQVGYWRTPESLFSHAVEVDRDNWMAWGKLGAIRGAQGRHAEAAASYREAIRVNIGDASAWSNLGVAYLKLGDPILAAETFRSALKAKPGYPVAHFNLAFALEIQGRRDEAIDRYRETLRLDPGYDAARLRLDALMAGGGGP